MLDDYRKARNVHSKSCSVMSPQATILPPALDDILKGEGSQARFPWPCRD